MFCQPDSQKHCSTVVFDSTLTLLKAYVADTVKISITEDTKSQNPFSLFKILKFFFYFTLNVSEESTRAHFFGFLPAARPASKSASKPASFLTTFLGWTGVTPSVAATLAAFSPVGSFGSKSFSWTGKHVAGSVPGGCLAWMCCQSNGGLAFTINVCRHNSHMKAAASFLKIPAR